MVNVLEFLMGAVVGAVLPMAGYRLGRRRAAARPDVCTCGHARSFHALGKGECRRPGSLNGRRDGCQLYDGPPSWQELTQ